MAIPGWVDFESAERSAAVMARGLSGQSEAWGTLLAHAQAVLASRTDTVSSEAHASYAFEEWEDLVAAARILDLAATEAGIKDPEDRRAAAILAACAFGMSGTHVSATAVIRSHRLMHSELSPGELAALALSSPILGREVLPKLPAGSKLRDCIESTVDFLGRGREEQFNTAERLLREAAYEEPGAWEGYLLRLSRLSLAHVGRLATAKVLRTDDIRLSRGYLDKLVDDSPLLLPSQYEAVIKHGVLAPDQNLLITLPTGTGKTLLGELALMSSLGQGPGLVCYIAPYVALGRQVAEKISRHTPPDVRVHRLMGGYKEPETIDPEGRPEIVVATLEQFDAMLRLRPDLLPAIRCVVFDEAHMISNEARGIRLEGILTRLRLTALNGQAPRFVFLSAVLSNVDALANWVGVAPDNVIQGTWRPTAKRLLRWTEDGMLRLHAGDDPLRSVPAEVLGETQLPWPKKGFYRAAHYGAVSQQTPQALENVAFLAAYENERHGQPVLCVCSTRSKTMQLVAQIAQRFPPLEPLPHAIKVITDLIDQKYRYLRPLKDALQRGLAYHNASLPQDVREKIERAAGDRALKVVTATTTLAEGVDLPFRTTILADWLMFDGTKERPMESLLFKNIAGRCGRAGQFTEGDTIIFDNPVGDKQLTFPAQRLELQADIFFAESQPMLTSSIGRIDRDVAVSTLGSQLLAAIAENPDTDDLVASFHMHSFAYQAGGAGVAAERISSAYKEILDPSEGQPLAVTASPARLTPFGEAANHGGLSPGTAKRLRGALAGVAGEKEASQEDLVATGVALLRSLADVPEQTNSDLRKAITNPKSRPVVRPDELTLVLDLWLGCKSIEDIFAALPANQRSTRSPGLQTWLEGVSEESTWTDRFAKFYDFMNSSITFFLPWVLRAAGPLAEMDGQQERPWSEWARFVEQGVKSNWGARLLEDDVVTERPIAFEIGQRLDALAPDFTPTLEQVQSVLTETLSSDDETIERVLNWFRQRSV